MWLEPLNLKAILTFLFFFGAATPVCGAPNYSGILVQFRGVPNQNIKERNALHESLKQNLLYRSKFLSVDVLVSGKSSERTSLEHLRKTCTAYLKNRLVLRCEPNEIFKRAWSEPNPQAHEDKSVPTSPRTILQSDSCALVDLNVGERLIDGTLSPFWAQETIGADLAGKVLGEIREELKLQGKQLAKTAVGVVDVGFEPSSVAGPISTSASIKADPVATTPGSIGTNIDHGTQVSNLIAGDAPVGVARSAELTVLAATSPNGGFVADTDQVLALKPKLVNFSMGLGHSPIILEALSKMSESSILVAAAGNEYPSALDLNKQKFAGIVVGSIGPMGLISDFSIEGKEVTVLAPSDRWIQTITNRDDDPRAIFFGGTSGATPLVTGALANVLSILPDLSLEEAKAMLTRSAIPTMNSWREPLRNGAGTLNALKLGEVARRAAKQNLSGEKRLVLLSSSTAYDFDKEAEVAFRDGQKLLKESSCESRKQGFDLVRRSFLLSSKTSEKGKEIFEVSRRLLVSLYEKEGLISNARFYRSLDKKELLAVLQSAVTQKPEIDKFHKGLFMNIRTAASRSASYLGVDGLPILLEALKDESPYARRRAILASRNLGQDAVSVLKVALEDKDPLVKSAVKDTAQLLHQQKISLDALGETGKKLIER